MDSNTTMNNFDKIISTVIKNLTNHDIIRAINYNKLIDLAKECLQTTKFLIIKCQ